MSELTLEDAEAALRACLPTTPELAVALDELHRLELEVELLRVVLNDLLDATEAMWASERVRVALGA